MQLMVSESSQSRQRRRPPHCSDKTNFLWHTGAAEWIHRRRIIGTCAAGLKPAKVRELLLVFDEQPWPLRVSSSQVLRCSACTTCLRCDSL